MPTPTVTIIMYRTTAVDLVCVTLGRRRKAKTGNDWGQGKHAQAKATQSQRVVV